MGMMQTQPGSRAGSDETDDAKEPPQAGHAASSRRDSGEGGNAKVTSPEKKRKDARYLEREERGGHCARHRGGPSCPAAGTSLLGGVAQHGRFPQAGAPQAAGAGSPQNRVPAQRRAPVGRASAEAPASRVPRCYNGDGGTGGQPAGASLVVGFGLEPPLRGGGDSARQEVTRLLVFGRLQPGRQHWKWRSTGGESAPTGEILIFFFSLTD